MSIMLLVLLMFMAAFTSVISAVTGMGGGVLLFSIMSFFFTVDIIVPVHGAVQFGSNISRVFYLKNHVMMKFCYPFFLGAIFGAIGAVYFKKLASIPDSYSYAAISILIVYVLFKPKSLPKIQLLPRSYLIIGLASGFLGIFIGTVGPFIAAFFVRDDITKENIISTKAVMQLFIHTIKVPSYMALGFHYEDYLVPIILMVLMAFIGTKVGIIILQKISQRLFLFIMKSALFLAVIRLLQRTYHIGF